MDLDDLYVQIGEFGIQQKIYFITLGLVNLYAPTQLLQVVFTGRTPLFTCKHNGSDYNNSCPMNKLSLCDNITYEHYPESFAKEWDLICDQTYKSKLVETAFMLGVAIGALVLGPLADAFGRRKLLGFTLAGLIISGLASSFIPYFIGYVVFRILTGFFCAGNILAAYVLCSELVGPSKRGFCGNVFQAFFAFGIVVYSGMAIVFHHWRILSFATSAVAILYFFFFLLLPESPRWLLTHNRSKEAKDVLRNIASRNNMIFPSDAEIVVPISHAQSEKLWHLFRQPKPTIATLIMCYSWLVNSCIYYGLTLASDKLGSNIYESTILSGLVELPAYVLTAVLIDTIGRRIPLAGYMILGGISCFAVQFIPEDASFYLALLGKLSIAGSFAIIYVHSSEIFPTVIRNSGLGLCSMFARFGGMAAPIITLLDASYIVFGVLSLTSGLLNLLLDETLNKSLPETIEDMREERDLRGNRGRYAKLKGDSEDSGEENHNKGIKSNIIHIEDDLSFIPTV